MSEDIFLLYYVMSMLKFMQCIYFKCSRSRFVSRFALEKLHLESGRTLQDF